MRLRPSSADLTASLRTDASSNFATRTVSGSGSADWRVERIPQSPITCCHSASAPPRRSGIACLRAFVSASPLNGQALRRRERRFESCWGRFLCGGLFWRWPAGSRKCPLSLLVTFRHSSPLRDVSRPPAPPGSWLVRGQGLGHAGDPEVVEAFGAARVDG